MSYDPPQRLRELPSWLTAQAARRAQLIVEEQLASAGARRAHYSVLASLAEQGAASQADLGRRLWIDRSDLHALVNELQDAGHVSRSTDPTDRRRNVVAITASGRHHLRTLDRRIERAQAQYLEPLPAADHERAIRLLTALAQADARSR
jgi:MarR family transcriptional regulator, lower aerobic nicotinate degradation pathway regulator